jgi:hypothetical protein
MIAPPPYFHASPEGGLATIPCKRKTAAPTSRGENYKRATYSHMLRVNILSISIPYHLDQTTSFKMILMPQTSEISDNLSLDELPDAELLARLGVRTVISLTPRAAELSFMESFS